MSYDDWKARAPVHDDPNEFDPEQRDANERADDNDVCGWCGRPWGEIEDHDEPCAEDQGQFIGPHQRKRGQP